MEALVCNKITSRKFSINHIRVGIKKNATTEKRLGLKADHCCTPTLTLKPSVSPHTLLMRVHTPSYISSTTFVYVFGIPFLLNAHFKTSLDTLAYTFSKSITLLYHIYIQYIIF